MAYMRTTDRAWVAEWERTEERHKQAIASLRTPRYYRLRMTVRVGFWVGVASIGYFIPPLWWG